MIFKDDISVTLTPSRKKYPWGKILEGLVKAHFEPKDCRKFLRAFIPEHKVPNEFFDLDAVGTDRPIATDALLYGRQAKIEQWALGFKKVHGTKRFQSKFKHEADAFVAATDIIRAVVHMDDIEEFRNQWGSTLGETFFEVVSEKPALNRTYQRYPTVREPGIYRREHASVLIRSRTTSIMFDPLIMTGVTGRNGILFSSGQDKIDAVLVTHFHGDHFHLPSVLAYVQDKSIPVVIKRIPKPTIVNPTPWSEITRLSGQNVLETEWNSTITIGDIEIDVLPFYGEQLTCESPGPPDPQIRNWGNCYRVNTPDFSALLLADSGIDPAGSMIEVAKKSFEKRGQVDCVLASLQQFPSPFVGGLDSDWIPLSFRRLEELYRQYMEGILPITTAGPDGIAEICEATKARYYLPYANGIMVELGQPVTESFFIPIGSPEEQARLKEIYIGDTMEPNRVELVAAKFAKRKLSTVPVKWNTGDKFLFDRNHLNLVPFK